ncbi:MAG: CBS domain-containing protein [Clostridia bacterium]|nr:CBS domain-containing protein [Clostridia bacterium]
MKVKECMSLNVCCCTPDTTVTEIAKKMCDNHIGCIPVCDTNNTVVGVLTDRDIILRTVACNKDANITKASDIMTCKTCCCTPETDINEATKLMSDLQIRRIPVCDNNNKIVGILSLGDLANNDNKIGAKQVCDTLENICNCDGKNKNAE